MQGTAIKGSHWLEMDLGRPVVPTRMLLDWEAAYADIYDIQGRLTGSVGALCAVAMGTSNIVEREGGGGVGSDGK
jgi:hypothetical protein